MEKHSDNSHAPATQCPELYSRVSFTDTPRNRHRPNRGGDAPVGRRGIKSVSRHPIFAHCVRCQMSRLGWEPWEDSIGCMSVERASTHIEDRFCPPYSHAGIR